MKWYKHRDRDHHRRMPREQSSYSQARVRRLEIPRLMALERLGSVARERPRDLRPVLISRLRQQPRRDRLPLVGLLSQIQDHEMVFPRGNEGPSELAQRREFLDRLRSPEHPAVCKRRKDRRVALFRSQVAGRNRKRSPGQGGTYRRDLNSEREC